MDELTYASAAALAGAVRGRAVSSEEAVRAHLERIRAVNPRLNALVEPRPGSAAAEARAADASLARGQLYGPLHGVPLAVDESLAVAGMSWTGGVQGRSGWVAHEDATAVARARGAGAVLLGSANVSELGMGYECDNLVYGRTSNPYDLSRTPGGGSGGLAALVASGGAPFGLGNDLFGGLRVCAHFCGLAGLKPTPGRVPGTGCYPPPYGAAALLGQAGLLARSVEDLGLLLAVVAGPDGRDPYGEPVPLREAAEADLSSLRAAFYTDDGVCAPTPETAAAVRAAAACLERAGAAVAEERPPELEQAQELWLAVLGADSGEWVRRLLANAGSPEPHPLLEGFLEQLRPHGRSTADFIGLWRRWDLWRSSMLRFMQGFDLVVAPVCAGPAMLHGTTTREHRAFGYAEAWALALAPAVVVRAGTSPEGLPIGVQLVARRWREHVALAAGRRIEAELGGWRRPQAVDQEAVAA